MEGECWPSRLGWRFESPQHRWFPDHDYLIHPRAIVEEHITFKVPHLRILLPPLIIKVPIQF
jgi:hypothetical protein